MKNNNISTVAVLGLGYVGLPLAVAFSKHTDVVAFDVNKEKVHLLASGIDPTGEVGDGKLMDGDIRFTSDPEDLRCASFFIVAVPTPIRGDKTPNLSLVESACHILGPVLPKQSIVVFESTVYPGVTEDICAPILEAESGLVCGKDFKVGYSPERINPSDKVHTLASIIKVVSGMDAESLDEIASMYEHVVEAGVYRASSIKVAEAAKLIENCQRDINIAFVNELSLIFDRMGIDTKEVLETAGTKWNFLKFAPGLVGGHCIGVDPYYLTHRAREIGYDSQVILAGRRINDGMGKYIAEKIVKSLIKQGLAPAKARVAILGFTFKENCNDTRNTKVMDIVHELREYGIDVMVTDPIANPEEVRQEYGLELVDESGIRDAHAVAVCVSHDKYLQLTEKEITVFLAEGYKMLFDVKGMYDKQAFEQAGYSYLRL